MDKVIRAIEKNGKIRIFGAITTELVDTASKIHNTSSVVSAALGRCLTANCMMGIMLKGENETVSLQIKGDGPLTTIVTAGNCKGEVRGYVGNNFVELPLNDKGKLDVGKAVGNGYLTVIRDLGLKEPYIGRVELQTGEIADDLTYYYASSEQVPSVIALGVLVDRDLSVKAAGGYIIQLMPQAEEEVILRLEENIKEITPITTLIDEGKSIEEILAIVLKGFDILTTDTLTPLYKCNCNRDKIQRAITSLGKEEIKDIIETDEQAELVCYYCNTKYLFDKNQLLDILRNS